MKTCFCFVLLTLLSDSAAAAERPNIILMMCDDLGWGDVGFNGGKIIQTPHLDEMAKAGLRFERFYAAAPVCSPTRGSCITGRHPYRYGVFFANVGHMQEKELTLAELLKEHGYTTGHFGKWHLGTLTKTEKDANRGGPKNVEHFSPPWVNGFDQCFSTESKVPTWDPLFRPKSEKGRTWWDAVTDASDAIPYGTAYWSNGDKVTEELRGDDSKIVMDRAIPFIREAASNNQPFFTIVWFHAPHLPVVAGPEYTKLYSNYEKYQQHYYGCITALDEQVGRLRRELRNLKVADNTLVFFCSDNGPEGNEKAPGSAGGLRGRKRSLFEGGVRVPGLVEWPAKIKGGSETKIPACTSDYLPTILDLIGAEAVDDRPIDGISLLPMFAGKMRQRRKPIGFESGGQLAFSGDCYKIVLQPKGKQRKVTDQLPELDPSHFMLFDLPSDRAEANDLSQDHPDIVKKMVLALQDWRSSCRASLRGEDYR
ncbi:MAG: N-acetylgalactosamine 6-sulfate sulfatase [Planctomycetaceae bacterium]|nr:N-acetylgalactosamine 6-sulfate sulfatase [Planctomycetaceae bacterium]